MKHKSTIISVNLIVCAPKTCRRLFVYGDDFVFALRAIFGFSSLSRRPRRHQHLNARYQARATNSTCCQHNLRKDKPPPRMVVIRILRLAEALVHTRWPDPCARPPGDILRILCYPVEQTKGLSRMKVLDERHSNESFQHHQLMQAEMNNYGQ